MTDDKYITQKPTDLILGVGSLLPTPYSLLPTPYSLLPTPYSLLHLFQRGLFIFFVVLISLLLPLKSSLTYFPQCRLFADPNINQLEIYSQFLHPQ